MLNRIETAFMARSHMNIEAEGMANIRLLFPVRARLIDEALDLATSYAWNSLRNLQLLEPASSRFTPVHQIVTAFLGVPTVLPEHVAKIEKVISNIFAALLDPSLRKPTSGRFAIGRVVEQQEHTLGFTISQDEKRRIYLAEKFFFPNFDHYRNYMTDPAFPIRAHARAGTIIHELSHIVEETVDLAYVDPGRPFTDLIETTSLRAVELRNELIDLQSRTLSNRTPLSELFTLYDPFTDTQEDLDDLFDDHAERLKARILKVTGQKNLTDARQSFMSDSLIRLAVQLSNADSLTLLITQLGRQLHTSTP